MFPGSPPGCAPGNTRDMILSMSGSIQAGQAFVTLKPWDYYRERFWTFFAGAKWLGINRYVKATGDLVMAIPFEPGTSIGSVWAMECGMWDTFLGTSIPTSEAEFQEQANARRLQIQWKAAYVLTTVTGDAQLSSISITGARRGRNVAAVEFFPQRGRLTYAIIGNTPNASDRIVRWYNGDQIVAEGYRNGNGVVTCTERNGSGMQVTCTIAYTADVKPGVALLDIKWPKSYQIHFSTSALTYPRTPEATLNDNGNDEYFYIQATDLPGGSYNYNVLQVDDEGDVQTAISAPADSPQTINAPPAAPTITSVTGNAGAITVNFSNGEAGCTYKAYYSPFNEPINYGSRATPAPVGPSAVDATSITLPAIASPAAIDYTAAYNTLAAAFDAAVGTVNTAFAAGETGFSAALTTLETALNAAIDAYAAALGTTLRDEKAMVSQNIAIVQASEAWVLPFSFSTSNWKDAIGYPFGNLLMFCGALLESQAGRYSLPGGILPGAPASGAVGSSGADGFTASRMSITVSLKAIAQQPSFTRNNIIRIVVRATKGGIEELNDIPYAYELDTTGTAVPIRPNTPQIKSIVFTNVATVGYVTITAGVNEADARVAATSILFYIVTKGSAITVGTYTAIASLQAAVGNYHEVSITYALPGTAWYDFAVSSQAAGANSNLSSRVPREYSTAVPAGVSSIRAKVAGGRGIRPEES